MNIRRFRPEDRNAVIALLRECYGGWYGPASEEYWEWRHERNPHGRSLIWLAEDADVVVGCYILSPVRLRIGGETMRGAQSLDAAVLPDYRRRGLIRDLGRTAMEQANEHGIALTFAFVTEGAFRGPVRIGFESQFLIRKAYRPLGARLGRTRGSSNRVVREVSSFNSGFEELCADPAWARDHCGVARDPEYLNWRYATHAVRRYETLVCRRGDRPVGYCVFSVVPKNRLLTLGYIVDLQVEPGEFVAAAELVSASLGRMRSLGARAAGCWVPRDGPVKRALEGSGFSERWESLRRKVTRPAFLELFIVYVNEPATLTHAMGSSSGIRPEQWSIMPGDADYM